MMNKAVNYKNDPNKMRIRNFDKSFSKHECVKLLIMLISKRKHKDSIAYGEYQLPNGEIPDVVVELNGNLISYEVQKEISPAWIEKIKKRDELMPLQLLQKFDTIVIKLKELPDDLNELETKLEELVI